MASAETAPTMEIMAKIIIVGRSRGGPHEYRQSVEWEIAMTVHEPRGDQGHEIVN
jgi:hypothetical protein